MGRLIKWVIYLGALGGLALAAYAYIGPYFGADFSPPQAEIVKPVTLNAD